jgi:hypothetical protein
MLIQVMLARENLEKEQLFAGQVYPLPKFQDAALHRIMDVPVSLKRPEPAHMTFKLINNPHGNPQNR